MSRPPGALPLLQRARGKNGQHIGCYFFWEKTDRTTAAGRPVYVRVNTATKDEGKARTRRAEFLATGKREFVFDDDAAAVATPAAPEPAPVIPVVPLPVARQLAAAESPQPIVLPPEPAPLDQRPSEPEPTRVETTGDDWTKDASRAAGAPDVPVAETTPEPENKGEPAPAAKPVDDGKVRIKDIALMKTVFVSASRIAVQLQIAFHVLVARYLFKMELDPIRDEMPKDVAGFMAAQANPWPETDPREPGRAMWEQFGRRVCPDDLVVPDYVLAPALVALGTLPVQIANAKPVVKVKPHVPVVPTKPADVNPTNDPRVVDRAPAEPPKPNPHVPIVPVVVS